MFVCLLFIYYLPCKSRFNTVCIIKQSFFWWWYGINKRNIDAVCVLEMGSLVGCAPTPVKLLSHLAKCALKFSWIMNNNAFLIVQWLHTLIKLHYHTETLHLKGQFVKLFWIINWNAQMTISGISQFCQFWVCPIRVQPFINT